MQQSPIEVFHTWSQILQENNDNLCILGKINHVYVCSAVDFSTAFKYFGIKSIKIPLKLDIIRSTRSRATNRKKLTTPLFK